MTSDAGAGGSGELELRSARPDEPAAVEALVSAAGLPAAGIADGFRDGSADFIVAERAGRIVGVIGLERYGEYGLLRSAAVVPAERGRGVGEALVAALLHRARALGVRELWLLTTTAEGYFPRFGFEVTDRSAAPAPLLASAEFRGACPASAIALRRVAR
jgi:N-acetylglutamate synthase-like GNAT family acetyltransferase